MCYYWNKLVSFSGTKFSNTGEFLYAKSLVSGQPVREKSAYQKALFLMSLVILTVIIFRSFGLKNLVSRVVFNIKLQAED